MVDTKQHVQIDRIVGSVATGGWEVSFNFMNDQDAIAYSRQGWLDLMSEGGGVWEADFTNRIAGFMFPRGVVFDRRQSSSEAILATSHAFLEFAGAQGMLFEQAAAPATKHESANLTLGWIIYHIVNEHTNLADWVDLSGIDVVNSTSVNIYSVSETRSMWTTLQRIGSDEFHVPYFTKDDRLIYDVHPMLAYPPLPDTVLDMDDTMIIGQPEIIYRDIVRPDYVQLFALTDDGETIKSTYPDTTVSGEKRRHREDHLRCNSQARLDILAVQLYLHLIRDYDLVVMLPGAFGLELELYERVSVTYTGTTRNGITVAWSSKKWWIDTITVRRIHNFGAVTELKLQEEIEPAGYFYD